MDLDWSCFPVYWLLGEGQRYISLYATWSTGENLMFQNYCCIFLRQQRAAAVPFISNSEIGFKVGQRNCPTKVGVLFTRYIYFWHLISEYITLYFGGIRLLIGFYAQKKVSKLNICRIKLMYVLSKCLGEYILSILLKNFQTSEQNPCQKN